MPAQATPCPAPPSTADSRKMAARERAEAWAYVGGLSKPSKMPGYAYGISAWSCDTGSRLAEVEGSTCHGCYARKGFYVMPSVKAAHENRAANLATPEWVDAMALLVDHYCGASRKPADRYFRWHDSGDLQSVEHLRAIAKVAALTPDVHHWLPTREYRIVRQYLAEGYGFPLNLTVRLSAHMVDAPRPHGIGNLPTSGVAHDISDLPTYHSIVRGCPAPTQDNKCGDCRACWDPHVEHVVYRKH